jgi:hypothetical protein
MRAARIGQVEHLVHLGRGQRNGRRVDPHVTLAMPLHQRTGVAGVGLQVQHTAGMGVQHRVALHLLVGGQADHGLVARRQGDGTGLARHRHRDHGHVCRLLFVARAGLATRRSGLLGHLVRVDVLVDTARAVDLGRVESRQSPAVRAPGAP